MENNNVTEQDEFKGDAYAYTSFGEDNKKELYVVNMPAGSIYRVAAATIATATTPSASLSIYPNPASHYCNIIYTTSTAEACTIGLYNAMGIQLSAAKKISIAGKNSWQIVIPSNVQGSCYVTIATASGKRVRQNVLVE